MNKTRADLDRMSASVTELGRQFAGIAAQHSALKGEDKEASVLPSLHFLPSISCRPPG